MHLHYLSIDDRLDATLAAERQRPPSERRAYRERFHLSWLYHESHLEGAPVCESDLRRALEGCDGNDYCDGLMLRSLRRLDRVTRHLADRAFQRAPITVEAILDYHRRLTGLEPGEALRTFDGPSEHYKHDVLDPDDIREELEALVQDIDRWEGMRHPIQVAIEVHHRLLRIWPFVKGSALVARMVQNELLVRHGYPPALIHAQDRQVYYHAMHYDITRLQDVVLRALEAQIGLRERLFAPRHAPRVEVRAS